MCFCKTASMDFFSRKPKVFFAHLAESRRRLTHYPIHNTFANSNQAKKRHLASFIYSLIA